MFLERESVIKMFTNVNLRSEGCSLSCLSLEIKLLRVKSPSYVGRNYIVVIIEGLRHGESYLKEKKNASFSKDSYF